MWRVGLAVVLVAGVLGPAPGAVADIDQPGGGVQSDGSGGGQVVAFSFEVTTTSASGELDGATTSSSSGGAYVRPTCWYLPEHTGPEMAIKGPGLNKGVFADTELRVPAEKDYTAHATDDDGRWYVGICTGTPEGRAQFTQMMRAGTRWEWVPEGRAAPDPPKEKNQARAALKNFAISADGLGEAGRDLETNFHYEIGRAHV